MNNLVKRCLMGSAFVGFFLVATPAVWARTYVNIEPPEVRVETHEARQDQVWQSGYWRWHHNRHEWTSGHWTHQRHGRRWSDGRWERSDRGYYWVGGRWER
jgi:hypothetical protein